MKPHIVKFFQFLEDKESKNAPLKVKLSNPDKFKFTKEELAVDGDLDLSEIDIKTLPDGLQVGRNLSLYNCMSLKSLPSTLYVGGDLDLFGCNSLTSLPNGLQVSSGDLSLFGCTSLKSLPDGLRVSGDLDLHNCRLLTSFPNKLQIDGNLDLRDTPIAKMYSKDEIRAMIEAKDGYVGKKIYT